jgi:hypothetical protein
VRAIAAAVLALVLAPAAQSHVGRPVLPDAVAALQVGQVYVDYDASPSITRLEAGRLARSLPDRVRVAVLPAKVRNEVAGDPARTLADNAGHGIYLVVVGGQLTTIGAPATAKQAFDQHRSEGLGPALEAAAAAASQSSDGANWPAFAISTLLGLAALAALAYRAKQRATAGARSG